MMFVSNTFKMRENHLFDFDPRPKHPYRLGQDKARIKHVLELQQREDPCGRIPGTNTALLFSGIYVTRYRSDVKEY